HLKPMSLKEIKKEIVNFIDQD
ncbi:chemotaxis protein CheB, partial [Campylobacter jejuni]|nr:chemotaxis protein CheB [Campylobacter jejuni]MCW1870011.1 chemotaxis protein CheB [Campylobacter jejuni]